MARTFIQTDSAFERACARIVRNNLDGRKREDYKTFFSDLLSHGCSSGMVSDLIYTRDCVKFYKTHSAAIGAMLSEDLSDFGAKSPSEMFGDKWDDSDPLAHESGNQNLLAWYAFERACRRFAGDMGFDL